MDSLPELINMGSQPFLSPVLSLENDIVDLIYKYIWSQFEIRFKLLFILDEQKTSSLKRAFETPTDMQLKRFKKFIRASLEKCTDLEHKNFIFQSHLAPELKLISPDNLTQHPDKEIIKSFLERGIYLMFITYIHIRKSLVKSFKTYYQLSEERDSVKSFVKTKASMSLFLNNIKSLFYLYYLYIINKYAKSSFFIFPLQTHDEILLTEISTSSIFGGQKEILDTPLEIGLLKDQLEEKALEPNVVNRFTADQVKNMETILANKNINYLIKNKQLKLTSDLDNLAHLAEGKPVPREKFDKAFVAEPHDLDNLYQLYEKSDQKEMFLRYMVDKLTYYQHSNAENVECMRSIENIFDKILQSDFNKNSLNLQNEDVKFILMLETLDKIKNMFSQPQTTGNNITVNVFSDDVKKAKINDDTIDLKA